MRTATNKELQEIVDKLRDVDCPDCIAEGRPSKWPIESMDFDHLPGFEKKATISSIARSGDREALLVELKKCEVVCANHHRVRTVTRGASEKIISEQHLRVLSDRHKSKIGSAQRETIRRKSLQGYRETDKFGGRQAVIPTEVKSRAAKLGWERRRANPHVIPTSRDESGRWTE